MNLWGSRVLITGASRGIGAALAERFAAAGARVALVARDERALQALAVRLDGRAYAADLTDADQLSGLVARVEADGGPVDVLVNNAGMEATDDFARQDAATLEALFGLNLLAPVELCRQVLPLMLSRGRGHLVNVSSLAGVVTFPGFTAYGASKAGLSHFTTGLRADLVGRPVRTTLVQLGPVGTDMLVGAKTLPATRRSFARMEGLRLIRELSTAEVADATVLAVQRDQPHVRLPRLASFAPRLVEVPRWLTARLLTGVRHEPTS